MFITLAFSSLLNAFGLFCASKIMNMALTLVQAFIVAVVVAIVGVLFPLEPVAASLMAFAVCVVALKLFTVESVWGVIKLAIVGSIITAAIALSGFKGLGAAFGV